MANSSNAYITKQANSVDPSDWIMKQEQIGLQHQAIERQKKKDEEDRLNKTFEGDFDGEYDMSTSGNGTIDGALQQIAEQSLYELKEAKDAGEKALYAYGANSKQYREARQRYDNIMYRPKQLKLATTALNNTLTERQEKLSSGNYFQEPSDIDALNSFSKNPLKWKSMPNGSILINSGETTTDLKDFAGSLKLGGLIQRVDENATIQDLAKSFKDKVVESRDGYTTNKYTNTWEDYTGEDGNKVLGAKSFFTRHYKDIIDDNYAKSVLAGRGEFSYDSMPKETQKTLKANIINDMVEKSRPLIIEKKETDFNASKYSTDSSASKSKKTSSDGGSLPFVDKKGSKTIWGFDFTDKGTNKSNRPASYDEVEYDSETDKITIRGKKYVGKSYDDAKKHYDDAKKEADDLSARVSNPKKGDDVKKLTEDWIKATSKAERLESDLNKLDKWEYTSINSIDDASKVTSMLSSHYGGIGLPEIKKRLNRNESKENEETNDLPDIDALPDL